MEVLSFDRLLAIGGTLLAVAAIGFGLAMDTKTRGEIWAAIGCFTFATLGFLCTIAVWDVTTEDAVLQRILMSAMFCAVLGVLFIEAVRWTVKRHEAKHGSTPESVTGPVPPPAASTPAQGSTAPAPKVRPHPPATGITAPPGEKPSAAQRTELQGVEPEKSNNSQALGNSPQIQAAINKVLKFPNAVRDSTVPPTMIETLLTDQTPRKLFDVLMQYDEDAVSAIPVSGPVLRDFLRSYYQFEQDTAQFENELLGRIGSTVTVRFRDAWAIYLRYVILRSAGMSKDQVIAGGNFLNYDISWEGAEQVYGQLLSDPLIAKRFSITFSQYAGFVELINKLRASAQ